MKKFIKLKLFSQQVASNPKDFKKFARKRRGIFTICRYLGRIFSGAFMKNFFRIWTAFFALTFAAIFFAACGDAGSGENVKYVTLSGSKTRYRISDSKYTAEYFSEGYIYSNKIFGIKIASKNEKGEAAGEFKIIGSSLRIEIYEGQTLPSGNYIYVYDGIEKEGQLIGRIYITKTNDNLEFSYKEYNDYDDEYDFYW